VLRSSLGASGLRSFIDEVACFVAAHQLPSGAIPWYPGGITDPWDHVECAIALDLADMSEPAAAAYRWLAEKQNEDGSWFYAYRDGQPCEMTRDSNHSAYVATGAWYHYLATRDRDFLREMWPVIDRGLGFTLGLQQESGEVYWARDAQGTAWPSAPLTASSCIYHSLICGLRIARMLHKERPDWRDAAERLATAIRERPELFDVHGDNRRGYAMNWYYPVLTGAVSGRAARERLEAQWWDFVVEGWGCKCSLDQPWVTIAETCELACALLRAGDVARAEMLLEWVLQLQDSDGGFWTGIRLPEQAVYPPGEKTTWTSAAVILAALADSELGLATGL
jgi:hypothetical protein